MVEIEKIDRVYLLGIGGIGMSALARYFQFIGKKVEGYDKTASPLTLDLEKEGILVHYNEDLQKVPTLAEKDKTVVIYTCLLYTSDAADEEDSVDLGGRRII